MCTFVRLKARPLSGAKGGKEMPTQQVGGAPSVQQKCGSFTQHFSRQEIAASVRLGAPGAVSFWGDTTRACTAGLLFVLQTTGVF